MEQLIQAKMARLQELRQYQAYYGAYTPYPVVVEINQLEAELGRLLRASGTRPTRAFKPSSTSKPPASPMVDLVATVSFLGLMCVLAFVLLGSYLYYLQRAEQLAVTLPHETEPQFEVALRPTFTPTLDPNQPAAEATAAPVLDSSAYLPTVAPPTAIPTLVPTVTPRFNATSTESAALFPVDTVEPTKTPLPPPPSTPIPVRVEQRNTPTPAPPTATPAPAFPFAVKETGNRAFQKTTVQALVIYVAVVSEGNIPLGGYKIVGDHVPSGQHVESALSTWNWSVVNCLDCDYMKQGNLKFEPGPIADGVWNIYLADANGTPLSPIHSFSYSSAPDQWVWDFIIFRRLNG